MKLVATRSFGLGKMSTFLFFFVLSVLKLKSCSTFARLIKYLQPESRYTACMEGGGGGETQGDVAM